MGNGSLAWVYSSTMHRSTLGNITVKHLSNLIVFAIAFIIGWVIFNPPAWLSFGGWGNILFLVAVGVIGLFGLFIYMILANLPAKVRIDPLPDDLALPAEVNRLMGDYLALGFQRIGPPMRIHVAPPALMIGLAKPELGIYGTIFQIPANPPKVSYDMVSIIRMPKSFTSDHGGLTTSPEPGAGTLPLSAGTFMQIIREAPVKQLYRQHLLALEWLDQNKLPCDRAAAQAFHERIGEYLARHRKYYLTNPLLFTLIAVWRSITKLSPYLGNLSEQRIAQKQVEFLRQYQ